MASNETIGKVNTIYLQTYDTNGDNLNTNVSKGFIVNTNATYGQMDIAMRAINGLTTNTYGDTNLITEISLNEKMED